MGKSLPCYNLSAATGGALWEGAALRMRLTAMIVAFVLAGILPILWGSGSRAEVMSRFAGMVTAPLLSPLVIPAPLRLQRLLGGNMGRQGL